MYAGVVFSDYCSELLSSFLSFSFIFFSACVRAHARLFPLSHPWLMSLVYRTKTKRHCCNRVKLVLRFFLFLSLLIFLFWFFSLKKNKISNFKIIYSDKIGAIYTNYLFTSVRDIIMIFVVL
jgi:hypothetical protein